MGASISFESEGSLQGKVSWTPPGVLEFLINQTPLTEQYKLRVDIQVALQQTLEAIVVALTEPDARSYPKLHQPILDGVRQLMQARGAIHE